MKSSHPLIRFLLALACSFSGAIADQAPAPAPLQGAGAGLQADGAAASPVQDGENRDIKGGKKPFIRGGARIQIQGGVVEVQDASGTVQATARPDPKTQPPVIFLPGFPTVLIHNPLAKKDPRPGHLGVMFDTEPAAEDADPKKKEDGVGVLSVVENSPAEKAGMKKGDRLLTFEGKKVTDHLQLREMVRGAQPEQNVKLTVRREGKEIELKATLGAAPDAAIAGRIVVGGAIAEHGPAAVPGVVKFRTGVVLSGSSGTSGTPKTPADEKDTVTLRDGNVFAGKIRGITAEKGVQLQREGLTDLELIQEEITSLTFADRETTTDADAPKPAAQMPKVVLQMRDGSVFHGDALTMDHGALLLTLPAGPGETAGKRIEIPGEHAQFAAISDSDAPRIYDGPTGLTGWSAGRYSSGQWEYKDGFLRCVANGPIGRNIGRMPDPVDVSFDVKYPPQMQHFNLQLFSTDVNQAGVGTLNVQFSPTQINANHSDGQRTNQYSTKLEPNGQLNGILNAGVKTRNVRYRVLVDRVNGRALIYVNGEKHADWKLSKVRPEDLAKCGGAFSITRYVSMSGTMFQIGHVRVMPWDGREPQKEAVQAEVKGDQLFAGDGKVTEGTIDRITDSEVVFANPGAKTRREKTLFIRFFPPAAVKELAPAAATAWLKNGSQINAAKAVSNGDTLTLTTRSGPEVTVPLAELRELNFFPRPGQPEVTTKNLDVLTLTDGTQFSGRAMLPFSEQGVNWKIAASNTPLEFPTAKVAGVVFRSPEGERKTAPLTGDNALRLANGDWLQGEVVSLDEKKLVMKTDLAPALNFPMSELRAVYLNPGVVGALADGATGPGSWTDAWTPGRAANAVFQTVMVSGGNTAKSSRHWMYHDGRYVGIASRGVQQMLSKRWPAYEGAYAIHFELTSQTQGRSFTAQIYDSKEERTFSITSSGTRLYAYYRPSLGRANRAGAPKNVQVEYKNAASGGKVHVSLVIDRPAKTFRVIVDGKEVGKMVFKGDVAKEALDACGVSVSVPTGYSTTRGNVRGHIGGLWLAPWSGTPAVASAAGENDKPAADTEPKKEPEADAEKAAVVEAASNVFLTNGDEFFGTIEKLTSDLAVVNSEAGPLELPGKRVAWLRFPGPERPAADHFPRLRFRDRGLLSVNDLHITDDRVKCKTLDGQPLDFPLNVVKEVVWRPLDGK